VMLVLSQLSNLLKANHCNLLLPIEKMVPILMLLPGIFGVVIGSMHFLMLGCLTFLCTQPYLRSQLSKCYQLHEREKRLAYDERVREVERACFSPLVFAATGGMGPTATIFFRKLASMLAEKRGINCCRCLFSLVGFVSHC